MNKVKHLFDACVSHRNTLMVQRKAEEFFNNEEDKFYTSSHYGLSEKQLLRMYNKHPLKSFFKGFEDFKEAYEWWNKSRSCVDTSFMWYATNWVTYNMNRIE